MATHLQIDDRLIEEAVRLGGHKTKKEAVTQALLAYAQHLRRVKVLDLFGTIDFDPTYDYKAQRARS